MSINHELQNDLYTTFTWLYNQIVQSSGDVGQLEQKIYEDTFANTTTVDPDTQETIVHQSDVVINQDGKAELNWEGIGQIPYENLPHGAFDQLFVVDDTDEMIALEVGGAEGIHKGEAVLVRDSGLIYYLVDETEPLTMESFQLYTTTWDSLSGKPTFASADLGIASGSSIETTIAALIQNDEEVLTGLKAFMTEHDITPGEIPAVLLGS